MVERLSIAEFERLLSRGRGKAILHLQQHDAAPYRDAIRRCCLTNTAYDAQCENHRAPYLMDAIALSGEADALCEAVIQAVHRQTEYTHDFDQLFELLGQFTRRGYKMARQAMYAWCRVHYDPREMSPNALMPLLKIDGAQAFLFLLDPRQSGRYGDLDSGRHSGFEYVLAALEEMLGETKTLKAFWEATEGRPALREIIERLYNYHNNKQSQRKLQQRENQNRPSWAECSYADIVQMIDILDPNFPGYHRFVSWGEKASDADLYQAAVDFNTLTLMRAQQLCYLSIFSRRAFPLDDFSRLFEMIHKDQANFRVLNALKNISHPQIRAFALDMIASRNRVGQAVGVLQNNFEDGDWVFIESLFEIDLDEYNYHSLGFSISDVFKKHPSPDAIPTLIRMFDATPCSFCRSDIVKSLVSLNALPNWMAEECRYDASLDLRAYAERGFQNVSDD